MKIRLSELRRIIREVLSEETWPPGRWDPVTGEPVNPDDIELMGTGGLGHEEHDADDLSEIEDIEQN